MATKEKKKKVSDKKNMKESNEMIKKDEVKVENNEKKANGNSITKSEKKKKDVKKEFSIKKWLKEVFSEFKKVRWPDKKEMIKYSIATIVFILFFALFFYIIEIAIYLINQVM